MAFRLRQELSSTAEAFEGARSDYNAARSSRFRRRRTGVSASGSGADYHYRSESDYLRVLEQARDMDRNDSVIGQAITRATTNAIQDGITVDPQTGDDELDDRLEAKWNEWAGDPAQCDIQQERDFHQLEHAALRATFADGDIVALGIRDSRTTPSGPLQMIEAHRLRTPTQAMRADSDINLVHGFELDQRRRRVAVRITRDDIDPLSALGRLDQTQRFPIRDADGRRQIFHVYDPKRVTQTRGVSALAPVFDDAGMFEDINFAKMVQGQVVSCIAILRTRGATWQAPAGSEQRGTRTTETRGDGTQRIVEGIAPGMEVFGEPGETLNGFSPNVPNPEYFEHARLMLTLIGINLGLPLILLLLDGSETNFSGWRGALDQAKLGFRHNQKWLVSRFHRPIYTWKVKQWLDRDVALARLAQREGVNVFGHAWKTPGWPYIEPMKDAMADDLRTTRNLISQRRRFAERGLDFFQVGREIIEDRAFLIKTAWEQKELLQKACPGLEIDFRELAYGHATAGITYSYGGDLAGDEPVKPKQPNE